MPKNIVFQNGVEYNCYDIESAHFEMGHQESQDMVPWALSNRYARWTMWYAIATIGLFTILRFLNAIGDVRNKKGQRFNIPLKNFITGFCRFIGYRHFGFVSKWTVFPSQLGILLFTALSFLLMCLMCFVPHFWYRACFKFGSPPLAGRAGMISNALTPLIYGFAGKINVITALTGVSYEKLHIFHAMAAWISIFFAWVHTIPFWVQPAREGGAQWLNSFFVNDIYQISGVVAILLLTILCFFSLKSIRDRYYELFLHIHWPTSIAYLGVLFWHDADALESWAYLWATIGVYCAGLLYRYFKKTNYLQLRDRWFVTDTAMIRPLPDEAVEVNIYTKTITNWMPGEHIFVRFQSIQPLGNHPFTIASVPVYDKDSGYAKMRLVCRPYSGFTRMLYDQACKKLDTQYQVFWDGTYGGLERDVEAFDDVVLACSGSGATAVVPFLKHLASKVNKNQELSTKRIRLLWVIRNVEAFEWFREDIEESLSLLPNREIVQIDVHVTGESNEKPTLADGVNFFEGRPSIPEYFESIKDSLGKRTIILTSGCPSVREDVANAAASLQSLVLKGKADEVYLHTEKFGW